MKLTKLRYNKVAFAITVIGMVSVVHAGPIDPPIGPVGSTGKTVQEIFDKAQEGVDKAADAETAATTAQDPRVPVNVTNTPGDAVSLFKITQPGSYYLTANITGVSAQSGIAIAANNVTLDLNGFALLGVLGSLSGITGGTYEHNNIFNGTIRDWGSHGIESGTHSRIAHLQIRNCGGSGVVVGANSLVTECISARNSSHGFEVNDACVVNGCTSDRNGSDGFNASDQCIITDCTSRGNDYEGFHVQDDCIIRACVAEGNDGNGVDARNACVILNNRCTQNGVGIHTNSARSRIEGNHVEANPVGIEVSGSGGNFIIKNSAVGNTDNYDISSGNHYGQIVTPSADFSNSNPWANFSWDEG